MDWFPKIDYSKCNGCMACLAKCTHGVYAERNGKPAVANPHNCIFGCTGCQPVCPTGAITHPLQIRNPPAKSKGGCSCCCERDPKKSKE